MHQYDITLLTDSRYVNPTEHTDYIKNVLHEDVLVKQALENKGLRVARTNWDNPDFNWSETRYIIFRTTWDYFNRFAEFSEWLKKVSTQTKLINPLETIYWSLDKHYLRDLELKGIPIPHTVFIEPGEKRSLAEIVKTTGWKELVIKPAISGAARHTYRLNESNIEEHEAIFKELIKSESMLLQEFQHTILTKGEVAFMLFGGKYSHAVLKKAKQGDYRVQDDFGGSVHDYAPTAEEIEFAEKTVAACEPIPIYARVDVIWDNDNQLCVSELELIEPELWFRTCPDAAELFAEEVVKFIQRN
ncbi:MAG: RimK family alpha-L-glutamate ligase [Bacteroidia bacterium]